MDRVGKLTRGALAEMRALVFELRPGALAEEGLVVALARHAEAVGAREELAIAVHGPRVVVVEPAIRAPRRRRSWSR